MIRILLFVEPKPLANDLFRNSSWLTIPLEILDGLAREFPEAYELNLALPLRFSSWLTKQNSGNVRQVFWIDEKKIVPNFHREGWSIRDVWNSDFIGGTPQVSSDATQMELDKAMPSEDWDLIVTFGEEFRYRAPPNTMKLALESSPFSRYPFQPTLFADHSGLFRNSAPSRFFGPASEQGHLVDREVAVAVRDNAKSALDSFRSLKFKREFEKHLLLPLQASNYSSFDAQVDPSCNSQIDYLFQTIDQVPPDVGVVVTEHPEVDSLERKRNFHEICQGLKSLFPNVVYLPRAKFFPSASFGLLQLIDAVWTTASNIGPVADFLGKPVGTPPNSHVAYAATAHSIPQLVESINQNPSESDLVRSVYGWMFQRYLLPHDKAKNPTWFHNYLQKRIQSFHQDSSSPQSFVPTDLSADDFINKTEGNGATSRLSLHYQTLINQKVHAFRQQELNRLKQSRAAGDKHTFVLLNDTPRLETYRHIGCNHVYTSIQDAMSKRGFRFLYSLNGSDEYDESRIVPDIVLINGEGSFHHDSCRAADMMQLALNYKARGARIALINTLWESNSESHAAPLSEFDLVSTRDGRSQQQLQQLNIEARRTADLSLLQWFPDSHPFSGNQLLITDSIIYDRARNLFDASLFLGGDYFLLDHRQITQFNRDGCFAAAPPWSVSPNLLTHNCQVEQAEMVVAGRFHVAVARVALGRPFVFVKSNTEKISALLEDIGISPAVLDVTQEVDGLDWQGLAIRIEDAQNRFQQDHLPSIQKYIAKSKSSYEELFDEIARLVASKNTEISQPRKKAT